MKNLLQDLRFGLRTLREKAELRSDCGLHAGAWHCGECGDF